MEQFEVKHRDFNDSCELYDKSVGVYDSLDTAITAGIDLLKRCHMRFQIFNGDKKIAFVNFVYGTHITYRCEWIPYAYVLDSTSGKFVPYTVVVK